MKGARWVGRALVANPLYVGVCKSPEDFALELKRLKVPPSARPEFLATTHANATTHFFDKLDGARVVARTAIVCMSGKDARRFSVPQVHALLVHEAVHIWQAARESIGERSPSSEFEAYSVQAIAQSLMEAWAA